MEEDKKMIPEENGEYERILREADEYSNAKAEQAGIREQERLDKAYEDMMKRRKKIKGFFAGIKKIFTKQNAKNKSNQYER